MAHLASVYGDSGDALCKAHVMTYVEPVAESDVGSLCAVPEGVNPLAAYRGYLISDSLLAATMKGLDPGGVEVFSLGIPVVGLLGREGTTPVMLGPQLAFFSAEMSGIPDVSKQEVLARAVGSATAAAFGKFLGDARNPFKGSLVSFPLGMPQGRTVPRKNIGVVTVYSDRPGIMGGRNERWRVYSMVMRPYMDGIAALLSVLQTS